LIKYKTLWDCPRILQDNLFNNILFTADLELEVGGYIYEIEKEEEIDEIPTLNRKSLRQLSSSFDVLDDLGTHFYLGLMTTNAGGSTYLIPKSILSSETLKNIKESNT